MKSKRVLVLGAGLVVKPLLDDLLSQPDVELRLATLNVERAHALLAGRERAQTLAIDASHEEQLRPEVAQANVVISLLPPDWHVQIAQACLDYCVPLITTSYITNDMRGLDRRARACGVLLLNETGLDPGIDHMTAVELIHRVRAQGAQVVSLDVYCGGLPAPEANTNPWGYKFTWSPRGVVLAARKPVGYLEDGKIVERTFPDLFDSPRFLEVPGVGRLEAYPTRDSLRYFAAYGLREIRGLFRGTLRYPGWCETWQALFRLGLLDVEEQDWRGLTYAEFLARHLPAGPNGLKNRLSRQLGLGEDHAILKRFEWLGLLSDRAVPERVASSLDVVTSLLQNRLTYSAGERDMVVQEHHLVLKTTEGQLRKITSRLLLFGPAGDDSAMARTVSWPAAIACRLLLDNRVKLAGVHIPVDPQLARPILAALGERGLRFEEKEEEVPEGSAANH